MPQDVFVACTLPGPAQAPFARLFASRFNEQGRTLADAELIAACGTAAGVVVTATDAMTAAAIMARPDSVQVIVTYSVGRDHVDLQAAQARGIDVLSTPNVLIDVFANEPRIDPAYRTLPNVFGLPHVGSATMQTRVAMARLLAESVRAVFAGEAVANRLA